MQDNSWEPNTKNGGAANESINEKAENSCKTDIEISNVNISGDNIPDGKICTAEITTAELPETEIKQGKIKEDKIKDLTVDVEDQQLFYSSLFLAGKPLDVKFLSGLLSPFNLGNRLLEYARLFNSLNLGIRIRTVSGGFQMVADPVLTGALDKYFGEKPAGISKSALETLSIIAYRQPVTKAEIESVRGVDCSGSMKTLLDRELIAVSGRKNVAGRPLIYITTKYFLEFFGLDDISGLPTFREWQELKNSTG